MYTSYYSVLRHVASVLQGKGLALFCFLQDSLRIDRHTFGGVVGLVDPHLHSMQTQRTTLTRKPTPNFSSHLSRPTMSYKRSIVWDVHGPYVLLLILYQNQKLNPKKLVYSQTYQSISELKHIIPETDDDELRILGPFL